MLAAARDPAQGSRRPSAEARSGGGRRGPEGRALEAFDTTTQLAPGVIRSQRRVGAAVRRTIFGYRTNGDALPDDRVSLVDASAMGDEDLSGWLNDIAAKDGFLRGEALKESPAAPSAGLPPVRGAPREAKKAPKPIVGHSREKKQAPKPSAPPTPKDEAAIWDEEEEMTGDGDDVPDLAAPAAPAAAGAAKPPRQAGEAVKPRQRKHAYEYFNQWDAYDVDGECAKLEESRATGGDGEFEPVPEPPANEGLPPDMNAAMLAKMPKVEVERRALNEKSKGNEFYKASEYKPAITCYTHSLRLEQNNAVVYANRAMCHIKLKQFRPALGDCTAAIQIDDSYTKAYLRRGIAHRRLGQLPQAIADLDIVLHREPHNKEAAEHRRCAQIEQEKERAAQAPASEEREAAGQGVQATGARSGKKGLMIEEIDGDSDDEEEAVMSDAMRRFKEAEAAKDAAELARADAAESLGRERGGPGVDPEALQESNELLESMKKMNGGGNLASMFGNPAETRAAAQREVAEEAQLEEERTRASKGPKPGTRRLTIEEDESEEEAEEAPIATEGFEAAPKFAGARPGKVFRKGRSGLGYYPDAAEAKKEKATEKEAPKLAGGMRKLAIAEDSSSEEEEEVVPIRKLPASSSPPKAGMRALAIEEVEESDEEAPPAKPTPSAAAPAAASSGAGSKAGMKKLAIAEDSSSEEEEVVVPIRKLPASSSPAKAGGMKKVAIAESEGDSSDGAASSSSDDLLCATAAADAPLSAAAAAALAEADAVRMQGNSLFGSSKYEEAVLKYIEITVYL